MNTPTPTVLPPKLSALPQKCAPALLISTGYFAQPFTTSRMRPDWQSHRKASARARNLVRTCRYSVFRGGSAYTGTPLSMPIPMVDNDVSLFHSGGFRCWFFVALRIDFSNSLVLSFCFTQSIARSAYQAVFTVRGSVAPRHVTALKYGIVRRPLIPCTCVEKRAAHASSI